MKILPCPFCGHTNVVVKTDGFPEMTSTPWKQCYCTLCMARGSKAVTEDTAVRFWNAPYLSLSDVYRDSIKEGN